MCFVCNDPQDRYDAIDQVPHVLDDIHAEAWGELIDRLEKVQNELTLLARTYTQATRRQYAIGRSEGVRLALSYVRELQAT